MNYLAPDTNTYYERYSPADPSHVEVPRRPTPEYEYDFQAGEWYLPAEAQAMHEREEAARDIRQRYAVSMRLVLWLMRYVWPRLSDAEKAEIRQIIPDEMEGEIRTALGKLP